MESKIFWTKYGLLRIIVCEFGDAPVFGTLEEIIVPKGTTMRNGQILKGPVKIPKGAILFPRRDKKYPASLRWHIFPYGIYEAIRSLHHIRDRYEEDGGGEIVFLEDAFNDLAVLIYQLLDYRRLTKEKRDQIVKKIDECRIVLCQSQNPAKTEAAGFLKGASGIMDRTGRVNPSATLTELRAANRRLNLRLADIQKIDPRIGWRQIALILEKDRIHRVLCEIWQKLHPLAEELQKCQKYLPNWPRRNYWIAQLHVCLGNLVTIKAAPYPSWVNRTRQEMDQLLAILQTNKKENLAKAKEVSARICWALRFKKAKWEMENIIFEYGPIIRSGATLEEKETKALRSRLLDFLERFEKLNEELFRIKVKDRVRECLQVALSALTETKSPPLVKKFLKEAARKL